MKNINESLWEIINPNSKSAFSEIFYNNKSNRDLSFKLFHKKEKDNELLKFLNSSMDEIRSNNALVCRDIILKNYDCKDLEFVSKGVLRREISGDVSYQKQRDHFSHTLYNFLLGSYLFEKSKIVKKAVTKSSDVRRKLIPSIKNWRDEDIFYSVWHYVSLLHDIGYIFEGALLPFSSHVQQNQIKLGVEIINDFFNHQFWKSSEGTIFSSLHSKKTILEATKINLPFIDSLSILAIGDSLRKITHTEKYREYLKKLFGGYYSSDIFDLWQHYFKHFKQKKMAKLVPELRNYYESLALNGINNSGLRILDHGICSGLIIYKYLDLYHELVYLIKNIDKKIYKQNKKVFDSFFGPESDLKYYDTEIDSWWGLLVWATAATAFHNALQDRLFWSNLKDFNPKSPKLRLNDDPLTYLGILVDIIQEWDRYNVDSHAVFDNSGTIDNFNVMVSIKNANSPVRISYNNKEISEKVIKNLDQSLSHWSDIVVVD